jgi:uncharacterized membrane protein YhaH (DUF805 family)
MYTGWYTEICYNLNVILSFNESITTCLKKKYASIAGRATRSELWWFTLFIAIISVTARVLDGNIQNPDDLDLGTIEAIVTLAFLIPSITVYIRRLHDLSLSGWYLLYLIIGLIAVFSQMLPDTISGIVMLVIIIFYIYAVLAMGHERDNDYGPNPY